MERLQEQVTLYREDDRERRRETAIRADEIREAIAMQQGMWSGGQSRLQESIQPPASKAVVVLKERLADLELALEDRGWRRQIAMSEHEFSRWGIQQIILISRLFRIKNPLIQRGILVSAYYVFGRGVEVTSENETAQEVLDGFLNDPRNQPHIGHSALVAKEAALYTDGNIFWCFHTDVSDGATLIRTIDPIEIDEIICDPDDSSVPWYYHRRWTSQKFDPATGIRNPTIEEAWYVALGYTPDGVTEIKNIPLAKDAAGQLIPILHRKDGALEKWSFGCPRVYAAIDWARASKDLLTDYAGRMRALSRFAWDLETKGGPGAIANFKQAFATTLTNDGSMPEHNPTPESNSTWITGSGTKLSPIRTQGAATGPDEGRRLFHMVYMVFGLGEHFFSDINSGNLATATSLDRPTELKFLNDQEGWREDLKRIGAYVLERSAGAPKGKLREAGKTQSVQATINVNFPPIVEGDVPSLVTAAVSALTLNGYPAIGVDEKTGMKTLLSLLSAFSNVEIDVEEVIEKMYPDASYQPDRSEVLAAKKDMTLNPPVPVVGGPPNGQKPKPTVKEASALVELRKALTAFKTVDGDSKKKTLLQ